MQVGNAWLPCGVVSLALDGSVHMLDPSDGELKHIRTVHGHQRGVTSLALDDKSGNVISASFDGTVIEWEVGVGSVRRFKGKGHTASVSRLLVRDSKLISVSADQSMLYSSMEDGTFGAPVNLKGGVVDMELLPTNELVLTEDACITVHDGKLVDVQRLDFAATCMCATPAGDLVYIGGRDMTIRVFDRSEDGTLALKKGYERLILDSAHSSVISYDGINTFL
jgi:WD40 repeat protein